VLAEVGCFPPARIHPPIDRGSPLLKPLLGWFYLKILELESKGKTGSHTA
jgi:hypothetical protein